MFTGESQDRMVQRGWTSNLYRREQFPATLYTTSSLLAYFTWTGLHGEKKNVSLTKNELFNVSLHLFLKRSFQISTCQETLFNCVRGRSHMGLLYKAGAAWQCCHMAASQQMTWIKSSHEAHFVDLFKTVKQTESHLLSLQLSWKHTLRSRSVRWAKGRCLMNVINAKNLFLFTTNPQSPASPSPCCPHTIKN